MKAVIVVASALACAFSLDAQITGTLVQSPDGSAKVRIRNNSPISLAALAISVDYVSQNPASHTPIKIYVDPEIDTFPGISMHLNQPAMGPLPPNQEFTMEHARMVPRNHESGRPLFRQPVVTAGIFADGSTAGDRPCLLA